MDSISFGDYVTGGAHDDLKSGAHPKLWTSRRQILAKEILDLPCNGGPCIRDFFATVAFTGSQEDFVDTLLAYMLLEDGNVDFATRAFKKVSLAPTATPPPPVRIDGSGRSKLLEDQGQLIQSLTARVESLIEAPLKGQLQIPTLSLKAIHEIEETTNNPR